jgi:branched-chain amino acid aminotransferase
MCPCPAAPGRAGYVSDAREGWRNCLNSQLSKTQARVDGYAEGIMLDSFGFVAEGSGENLFLVRDEVLYTSPVAAGILHGITRDSVIRIARDLGVEVREQNLPREMLYIADELFFCGTAAELTPIRSVDRIEIGAGKPGPLTIAFQSASWRSPRGESRIHMAGSPRSRSASALARNVNVSR